MTRSLTALGKKSKNLGALGSNFIHENYVALDRAMDFMGQPEKQNPDYAPARKPYKDPTKFKVVESADMRALRAQLRGVAKFRNLVKRDDELDRKQIDQQVPRHYAFLEPKPAEVDAWAVDAKAERVRHAAFIAKEREEMAKRRAARLLGLDHAV